MKTLEKRFIHTSISNQIYNFRSIGSLGQGHSTGTVTAVVLDTAFLKNTTNGLRIKTWQVKSQFLILALYFSYFPSKLKIDWKIKSLIKQGGNGYVKGVRFENVEMQDVANPIIIDQFYCDSPSTCQNQVSFT